ncbi:acyl-CoA carboxylase epsilon subunit [Streptomyces cyaneofuscatus]|uniref:acyl-CoA carboxylase epsilon subunit n=1 Tax=Streptomyces cyaneofuscatus TaxID=66883 RepID=UPI00367FAB3F
MTTPTLRVEKGHAEPEEIAAITALLMARAAAAATSLTFERPPLRRWHNRGYVPDFRAPHSWCR